MPLSYHDEVLCFGLLDDTPDVCSLKSKPFIYRHKEKPSVTSLQPSQQLFAYQVVQVPPSTLHLAEGWNEDLAGRVTALEGMCQGEPGDCPPVLSKSPNKQMGTSHIACRGPQKRLQRASFIMASCTTETPGSALSYLPVIIASCILGSAGASLYF